ncbi:hypothetical protein D9M69_72490 [compost metagenome]
MRDRGGDRRPEEQRRQLVERRPEIGAGEIGHEREHADGKAARPEGSAIDGEKYDQQENDVRDVAMILENRCKPDHRNTDGDGDNARQALACHRRVANGETAFDRQRRSEAEGGRRQRRHEIVKRHQEQNGNDDRRGDAGGLPQAGEGRIVGKKPIAHTGTKCHRMPLSVCVRLTCASLRGVLSA